MTTTPARDCPDHNDPIECTCQAAQGQADAALAEAAKVRAAALTEAADALQAEPAHAYVDHLTETGVERVPCLLAFEAVNKLRRMAAAARPDADMAEVIAMCPEHGTRTETYAECRCAPARPDFQDRGEGARQAAGIDGTAGDAQDVPHDFVVDTETGGCLLCGLAPGYRKHTIRPDDTTGA